MLSFVASCTMETGNSTLEYLQKENAFWRKNQCQVDADALSIRGKREAGWGAC
jgi:hypothetical protein